MADTPAKSPDPLDSTRLESDEEIRQALDARRAKVAARKAAAAAAAGAPLAEPVEPDVHPDRPLLRPPMALLTVLDDGRQEGEVIRLRADRTVIGRVEGDVRIPHDPQMSSRHAEVVRQKTPQGYRWLLVDLDSTNGTMIRIGSTVLRHGNEFLVGSGRYRFEAGGSGGAVPAPATPQGTVAWGSGPVTALVPSLVELAGGHPVQRFPLSLPEYWIGRDPGSTQISRSDDLLTSPKHVRLFRDAKGHWHAENNRSLNGLWLRMEQVPLGAACQFRLGEQRFIFRLV